MTIPTLYNRFMLLILVLGMAAYTAAAPALYLAIFAIPAAYVGWRVSSRTGPSGPPRLPGAAVNILLMGVVAWAVYRSATHGFEVSHVAELVVLIQLIKLGDRRGPRDDSQILFLSVFLAIAAMLTSVALWVGIILAIYLPVLIGAVILFQLHKGSVLADVTGRQAVVNALPARQRTATGYGGSFVKHFRRTVAVASVGTLLAALAVFVIMPRGIGENTFGNWGNPQRGSVTGFTDRVSLGTRGIISESPTVVLDLVVREPGVGSDAIILGGRDTVHYLRGAVLDVYHNGTWRTLRGEHKIVQHGVDVSPGEERLLGPPIGPVVEQVITLRSTTGRRGQTTRLFSLWRPVKVQVQRQSRLAIHVTDGILERAGEPGPLTYTVWSSVFDGQRGEAEERTPTSFDSEPIRTLAADILANAGIDPDPEVRPISDDSRAARAIQDYLRANFEYTLEEQYIPPDVHPIEHFLFTTRRGHCEYYASAMVAMCRSVGIYARMVTGYVAAEYNSASGHYTVRESNAHAWVEAEAGHNRWRRFDPTPQSDLVRIHRPQPSLFGRLRQVLDAVEFAWNSSIVGFDAGRRERLLQTSRVRDSQLVQRIDSIASSRSVGGSRSAVSSALATLALVFACLAVPSVAAYLGWRWIRRPRSRRRGRRGVRRESAAMPPFYAAFLRALARRGHPKPPWRPPLVHAESLPKPELSDAASRVSRLYYQSRFAGRALTGEELTEAERLVEEMSVPGVDGQSNGHRLRSRREIV